MLIMQLFQMYGNRSRHGRDDRVGRFKHESMIHEIIQVNHKNFLGPDAEIAGAAGHLPD